MVGWHHWLDGHEFEQAPGVGDGQGSLACCSPWGCKELDKTGDRTELNWRPVWLSQLGEAVLLPSSGWRSVMLLNTPQCTQHSPLQQSHPDQKLNSVEFGKLSIGLKGLPKCLNGKESICQCRRCRFDPWVKKIPWRRKWQPTPLFLPGISHGQRSLVSYSPWSGKETDTTKQTRTQARTKLRALEGHRLWLPDFYIQQWAQERKHNWNPNYLLNILLT